MSEVLKELFEKAKAKFNRVGHTVTESKSGPDLYDVAHLGEGLSVSEVIELCDAMAGVFASTYPEWR